MGFNPPPSPRNFYIFLKSEEKEVERGKLDGGGVIVNIFSGGGGIEKCMFGRLNFFGGLLVFLREGSRFLGWV